MNEKGEKYAAITFGKSWNQKGFHCVSIKKPNLRLASFIKVFASRSTMEKLL